MVQKVIIIGGVAGGATAAAKLRRISEDIKIILVERGEYISFANCGLPYYIGKTITERSKLLVQTVQGMSQRFNMDIRNLSEAVNINPDKQSVTIRNLQTGEIYEESYDKLLLSPGARPNVPKIEGIVENETLLTLRNLSDTDRIKAYVDEQKPTNAVVVGGGFIGLEMAENLVHRGMEVTIVQKV